MSKGCNFVLLVGVANKGISSAHTATLAIVTLAMISSRALVVLLMPQCLPCAFNFTRFDRVVSAARASAPAT